MRLKGRELKVAAVISQLKNAGADEVEFYEKKLIDNIGNIADFKDLLSEARAALMFLRYRFKVIMQDSPDLYIEFDGEAAYAEVKHFREKEQDLIDDQYMQESADLVQYGNTIPREGRPAWEQIAQVAIKKADKYKKNFPNLLIIETDSNSVDDSILSTAVNIYDDEVKYSDRCCPLRRLNGFVLIDQWSRPVNGNVIFLQTSHAIMQIGTRLVNALANIHEG